jgi:hypothetical protein
VYVGCLLMVAFTDFVGNPEDRHEFGYLFLYWIGAMLVSINFLVLFYDILSSIFKSLK